MPVVSVFISTYITTYAYMLLAVFLFGFIIFAGGFRRFNEMIYFIFPFALYVLCTFFTKTDSILLWGYQSLIFLLPVVLGYYYMYYKDEGMRLFSVILIVSLVITVITTIIGLIRFPYAARILATTASSDDAEAIEYWWNNIGGYDFVYTCVLLYPILILSYKLGKINRIVFFIAFIALVTVVILSEYAAALLLVIVSSVLFFAGKRLSPKQLFILGASLFLAMFLFWGLFEKLLLWLANVLNSDTLSERLTALAGGMTGLENSESKRIDLYRMSLESFIKSPIFGNLFGKGYENGGHSFILDSLANYGLLGGAVLLFSYRSIYRRFFKPFNENIGYGYVLWAFVQMIILSVVNTDMWLTVSAFFIPILLTTIYKSDYEEIYENSLDS